MSDIISKSIDSKSALLVEEHLLTIHPTLRRPPWETDLQSRLRISRSQIATPTEAKVLRDVLKHAKHALKRLQEECKVLQDYVDEHEYVVAPIRRVPPEVLGKIMMLSYPVYNVFKSGGSDAVRLGRVCKLWRDVSVSIPSLWSSFDLVCHAPGKFSAISSAKIANSLAIHLARSKISPLSVSITFDTLPNDIFKSVFDEIVSHSERWRTLQITRRSELEWVDGTLFRPVPTGRRLPALEYLHITNNVVIILDGFNAAPKLHTLGMSSYRGHFIPTILSRCGTQIVTLELHCNVRCLLGVLRSCPQVQEISMKDNGSSDEIPDHYTPITLSRCRSLMITWWIPWDKAIVEQFFGCISLPAARKIALVGAAGPADSTGLPLATFLERATDLEDLTLDGVGLDGHLVDYIAVLKSIRKCRTLRTSPPEFYTRREDEHNQMLDYHHQFISRLLQCLRIPPHSQHSDVLLPMLETLEVTQVDNSVWRQRWNSVQSILQARWKDDQRPGLRHVLIGIVDTPKARRFRSRIQKYATKNGKHIQVELYRGTSGYEVDESETSDNEEFEYDSLHSEWSKGNLWVLRDGRRSC